jgi:hypothetical protein
MKRQDNVYRLDPRDPQERAVIEEMRFKNSGTLIQVDPEYTTIWTWLAGRLVKFEGYPQDKLSAVRMPA